MKALRLLLGMYAGIAFSVGAKPCAGDTVLLKDGTRKTGRVQGGEAGQVQLSYQPANDLPVALLSISMTKVADIEFERDTAREELLKANHLSRSAELGELWKRFSPLLEYPSSPAGEIGLRHGVLLLASNHLAEALRAHEVFAEVSRRAPEGATREAARQGVLRALLAAQKMDPAVQEAEAVLCKACGPALRAEALLTLGIAAAETLRMLLENNPRWMEDERVRCEIEALREKSLEGYLGAALSHGAPTELVQRGLWGALRTYQLLGDDRHAREVATEVCTHHPQSAYAQSARAWLDAHPASQADAPIIPERVPAVKPEHTQP